MNRKELEKRVYDKYPVSKKERDCAMKKREMDEKRRLFKKRLIDNSKEKREYK